MGVSLRRALLAVILAAGSLVAGQGDLESRFASPPLRYGPSCFWWWFGAPYSEREIRENLDAMKAAGLGGFRIYPVYAFPGARLPPGVRNAPYLSGEFVELVRSAVEHGRAIGMTPETFLTSGWPYGGPYIPAELGAGELKFYSREVRGPARVSGRVPGEWTKPGRLLAVQAAEVSAEGIDLNTVVELTAQVAPDGALDWTIPPGRWLLMTFVSGYTGMKVKRAAPGGEGLVLDHFNREALTLHLRHNGEVQKSALAGALAIGLDSWEVYNSNWTGKLPEEFERRRGYSPMRYLPAIFLPAGPAGACFRHDFRRTVSDLAIENFFTPLAEWAHGSGLKLRAQAHGTPADIIEAYGTADFPEGETYGPGDRRAINIRDRKLAASAAHLFGRGQISCESFTWLRFPMFRVTLEQMKAAADAIYLDGINQVNYHGVPLSPDWAEPPGFSFYASTFVGRGNPWWQYVRHLSDYLRRGNFLLQQGEPVVDVAVYTPVEDVWANAYGPWSDLAGGIEQRMNENGSAAMLESLRNAGYDFDFVNARRLASARIAKGTLAVGPMRYRAVILPSVEAIEPDVLDRLSEFCRAGGIVIASGRVPSRSPALRDAAAQTARVAALAREMFRSGQALYVPPDPARDLSPPLHPVVRALSALWQPDVSLDKLDTEIGFVHRRAGARGIYFLANVGPRAKRVQARFRHGNAGALVLQPETGVSAPPLWSRTTADHTDVTAELEPWGSLFVILDPASKPAPPPAAAEVRVSIPVPGPWTLRRAGIAPAALARLVDWTELPGYGDFAGTAVYSTQFRIAASRLRAGARVVLDLGEVEDVGEVVLNGLDVGVAWKHPYLLDVTHAVKPGANQLEVRVTNRLINRMVAHEPQLPPPYRRVRDYVLKPEPAGLRGPVMVRVVRAQ